MLSARIAVRQGCGAQEHIAATGTGDRDRRQATGGAAMESDGHTGPAALRAGNEHQARADKRRQKTLRTNGIPSLLSLNLSEGLGALEARYQDALHINNI